MYLYPQKLLSLTLFFGGGMSNKFFFQENLIKSTANSMKRQLIYVTLQMPKHISHYLGQFMIISTFKHRDGLDTIFFNECSVVNDFLPWEAL